MASGASASEQYCTKYMILIDSFSSLFLTRRDACASHLNTAKYKNKKEPEPKPQLGAFRVE